VRGELFLDGDDVRTEVTAMRIFPLSRFASCVTLVAMTLTVWSVLTFATH
jgi:hypothetical protein